MGVLTQTTLEWFEERMPDQVMHAKAAFLIGSLYWLVGLEDKAVPLFARHVPCGR